MNIDVKHVAKLARLHFPEESIPKLESEMNSIIQMVENLPELNGNASFLDASHPMQLREDVVRPSLRRDEILKNAPETQSGCIVVPKTVE